MEKNKLMLREAMEILRARMELDPPDYDQPPRENQDDALALLQTHPACKRVDQEKLDLVWKYFRPFARSDKQVVASKDTLLELRKIMQARDDEAHLLTNQYEWRKYFEEKLAETRRQRLREFYHGLEEEEKTKFLEKVKEQRQIEHKRLHEQMEELYKRVVCAISGGVDSAVSACLLKQRGYDVVGVYMVNWDHVEEGESNCPRTKDQADAEAVCEKLHIDFHVVNFVKEYWNGVFLDFLENYKRGRTVVSDIACNRLIKFDLLHKFAFGTLQADAVATGHFARTSLGDFADTKQISQLEGGIKLLKAADPLKDQTFFLSTLTQEQLKRAMFPVGSMLKPQIRELAKKNELLSVAEKPESMGICFVGKKRNFDEFLSKYIDPVEGPIVDIDSGKTIGSHRGIHNYTLGKRLSVAQFHTNEGIFVSRLDYVSQTVHVCFGSHHPSLYARKFVTKRPHWIRRIPERLNLEFRIQRTHPSLPCETRVAEDDPDKLIVIPRLPVRAAAPGQTCAFYDGEECLGSAEIDRVLETL
ncbi:tRNA methyl transferase [Aphelenchoides avenae]|nr:tRNA methyl transferase [Aphelenchus avenae]